MPPGRTRRRDQARRRLPREVWALVAVGFAVAVGFGVVAPALPVFARHFGVGTTAAAAVVSVFALMRLTSALGAGRLVDRFGEREVLATGIAVVGVSSALAGLSGSYLQLLLLRGAGGVGSAMFSVSATSLLLRVAGEDRARAVGLFSGGFLLGGIAGPALGGAVTAVSLRAPFFVYAATLAVAGTVGLVALRSAGGPRSIDRDDAPAPLSLSAAFRSPAYRSALVANFADSWAAMGVRSALVPLYVVAGLHRSPLLVGAGFVTVAALNGAVLLPAGRYADRFGRRPVLVTGCATSAAAMLVLAAVPSVPGYLAAMAVFGIGSGMLDVAPAATVGDVVGGRGGTVVAAFQMAGDGGSVSGPVVAGELAQTFGYGTAFGATAAVLGLAALLAGSAPETRRHAVAGTGGGEVGGVGTGAVGGLPVATGEVEGGRAVPPAG